MQWESAACKDARKARAMEKGVKRRRRKGQCNQGAIIMLVQKSRSPKKKETERWSVVVTRRCWPGVAESVLVCSSGGEGRGGARRRRRLGSARGGRTGAEAARVLCFWRRSLQHQLAARSPGHPAPQHCCPCPRADAMGRARRHVARGSDGAHTACQAA
jgi:hypothetical protein